MTRSRKKSPPSPSTDDVTIIYTDGGCNPNPGPGGWGAILSYGGYEKEISGGEKQTTNNRMELTAAASALEALTRPCQVTLYTDSQYVKLGVTQWFRGWLKNNWRTANGTPVANTDLWKRLLTAERSHQVEWKWVKAHVGNVMNERVDRLATLARQRLE